MIHEIRAWAPAALWAGLLFVSSSIPDTGLPTLPWSDELSHFGVYTVLGATLAYGRTRSALRVPHWALILIGVLYGIGDEWHQSFVPGRDPALGDLMMDTLGVALGYAATLAVRNRRRGARIEPEERHN